MAQFADVCAQGSRGTMGILFACVLLANFTCQERRYSSTAALTAHYADTNDVTEQSHTSNFFNRKQTNFHLNEIKNKPSAVL